MLSSPRCDLNQKEMRLKKWGIRILLRQPHQTIGLSVVLIAADNKRLNASPSTVRRVALLQESAQKNSACGRRIFRGFEMKRTRESREKELSKNAVGTVYLHTP
jgi:hypothetical protein